MFSLSSLSQIAIIAVPRSFGFFGSSSWIMSDMASSLIRLGRLMELQGIASSRADAATSTVGKRKSKPTGGGGAAASPAETGTSPEVFGARRYGGAKVVRIETEDLSDVFDPTGFKDEWTLDEVERVVQALPGLQLSFDAADMTATIQSLDQLVFEKRTKDSTSVLVDADVAQGNGGFALWGDVTGSLDYHLWASPSSWALHTRSARCTVGRLMM